MKILILDPVGANYFDESFSSIIDKIKEANSEIHFAALGDEKLQSVSEIDYELMGSIISIDILNAVYQASIHGYDAFIINCFDDLSLQSAREISGDMLVLGPGHSSMEMALGLADSYSLILANREWYPIINRRVLEYGYQQRLASYRYLDISLNTLMNDEKRTLECLIEEGRKAKEEDQADALIISCTAASKYCMTLQDELGIPVIDPLVAAVKNAERYASLKKSVGFNTFSQSEKVLQSVREVFPDKNYRLNYIIK